MNGRRKLIITAAAVAVLVLVEVFGGRLTNETQESIRWIIVTFLGANGIEWVAGSLKRPPPAALWLVAGLSAWVALGCAGLPEARGVEWHGATVDARATGELHFVDGEWRGDGAVRFAMEAAWRISIVEQTASASVQVGSHGMTIEQRLTADVAKLANVEQTLSCQVDWPGPIITCELCGESGRVRSCRLLGGEP